MTKKQKSNNKLSRRLTIGYLAPQVEDEVGFNYWLGVAQAAKRHNVNLICFTGGILHDPQGFRAQANTVYNLVSAKRVDGLISWTSSMGTYIDAETHRKFYERYHPLPIVSLGRNFPGLPSVDKEDAQSMQALMTHLIETHGYRRLALIRGPERHLTAQSLYHAYIDVLESYGLPVDPRLITPPGDWAQSTGYDMIRVLFDQRGLQPKVDIEAVIGASDLLAIGALKALKQRGIQVPDDVAVVGLNDSKEARAANPLLTSVTVRFRQQANYAAELLLDMIAGHDVPAQTALPTKLVVRRSCGCASQAVLQASARVAIEAGNQGFTPSTSYDFATMLISRHTVIISEMVQALRVYTEDRAHHWAKQLLDAFTAELQEKTTGIFLATLEEILNQATIVGSNLAVWQRALSVMRHHLLPFIAPTGLTQAEDLWQQGRVLIGEIAQNMQLAQQFQTEQQSQVLREISQTLITNFELTELMDVLAQKLPQLGISGCYLSLYENPDLPTGWARLMLAYNQAGRIKLRPAGQRFPAQELVPADLLSTEQCSALVIQPLYFQNEQQGFAVFEGEMEAGQILQALCRQISSVLKGTRLFKQNVELYNETLQARTAAERANQLKTRLLANVTHELRNPLDIILGYTNLILKELQLPDPALPVCLLTSLEHIHNNAEYLQHVINDLLDLSRSEIDELDLNFELVNTRKFLSDIFQDMLEGADFAKAVKWRMQLPDRLPIMRADPIRLRQILLNLLGNARKFTDEGQIELGAEVVSPHIHIWVQDTGPGIPVNMQEQIFEPFVTGEKTGNNTAGIGLGLSITHRLVTLHRGSINVESRPGKGSTFHVYLPLPSLGDQPALHSPSAGSVLLVVSTQDQPPNEIINLSKRQGWEIRQLQIEDDFEQVLAEIQPAALAWDSVDAPPKNWLIMRQLRNIPRLHQIPFILYQEEKADEVESTTALTNLLVKPVAGETLLGAIHALCPPEVTGPILIVDDDPGICELYRGMVAKSMPGFPVEIANNGVLALEKMAQTVPSLVILDLIMPKKDGFDVLEQMRTSEQTRNVPVVILSGHCLTLDDIKRLEHHAQVTLQSKGILSEVEAMAMLHRALFDTDTLPPYTSALVKRTIAYFHQHYDNTLTRQEIAEVVGVNKDYLGQIFRQELGLSPWEYLNRYRIVHAKALLRDTEKSITAVAFLVGFNDPSYFGRVFRNQVGLPPRVYRKQAK